MEVQPWSRNHMFDARCYSGGSNLSASIVHELNKWCNSGEGKGGQEGDGEE